MSSEPWFNSGRRRMEIGTMWEDVVAGLLVGAGWTVKRYGQQLLDDEARKILSRTQDPQRWAPDFLASTPDGRPVWVEAKFSQVDRYLRPLHFVESAASAAHWIWHRPDTMPMIYAFPRWARGAPRPASGAVACWMSVPTFRSHAKPGKQSPNGTGNPFLAVPHDCCLADPVAAAFAEQGTLF